MTIELKLNVGEFALTITDTTDNLALGRLTYGGGNALMAPDGICHALGAIHRKYWGEWQTEMRRGSIFAVWLNSTREGSSFHYFANPIRLITVGQVAVTRAVEDELM